MTGLVTDTQTQLLTKTGIDTHGQWFPIVLDWPLGFLNLCTFSFF